VQSLLSQYRHLAAAVPREGTLLSAQLWVQPAALASPSPVAVDWLDFCLEANFADQLAIFSQGISPRLWGVAPAQLPEPLRRSPTLLSPQMASQSEFLLPLSAAAERQYLALWQTLRS
jgi:putative spermidine/putrescine transport system substrate-binding protein